MTHTEETAKQALLEPVQPLFEEHQAKTKPAQRQEIQYRPLSAAEYVQNSITFLNIGLVDRAKKELDEALALDPANRTARKLMRQITMSPAEYFKDTEYFEYVMRPDDDLSTVAEKFLKDPLKFHILAKYNNLDNPAGLMPGKILKIPGEKPERFKRTPQPMAAQNTTASSTETPIIEQDPKLKLARQHYDRGEYQKAIDLLDQYRSDNPNARDLLVLSYTSYANALVEKAELLEAQTVLEKALSVQPDNNVLREQLRKVKNKRRAERLYQAGLEQHLAGNDDDAFRVFRKVLELNPKHMLARKQLTQIKPDLIETYHKKAMLLYRKQELKEAIKIWDEVLRIDPQHELAKLYRARALELKRRIEQL
jgi:tetratricopeptide (TPR) repeat protein